MFSEWREARRHQSFVERAQGEYHQILDYAEQDGIFEDQELEMLRRTQAGFMAAKVVGGMVAFTDWQDQEMNTVPVVAL